MADQRFVSRKIWEALGRDSLEETMERQRKEEFIRPSESPNA
jgi:hypothetical protein